MEPIGENLGEACTTCRIFHETHLPHLRSRQIMKTKFFMIFLASLLTCGVYYISWVHWRWSNIPGMVIFLSGIPWSILWVDIYTTNIANFGPESRRYIDMFIFSILFSINITLLYLGFHHIRSRLKRRKNSMADK